MCILTTYVCDTSNCHVLIVEGFCLVVEIYRRLNSAFIVFTISKLRYQKLIEDITKNVDNIIPSTDICENCKKKLVTTCLLKKQITSSSFSWSYFFVLRYMKKTENAEVQFTDFHRVRSSVFFLSDNVDTSIFDCTSRQQSKFVLRQFRRQNPIMIMRNCWYFIESTYVTYARLQLSDTK